MTIDPTGTKPGLKAPEPQEEVKLLKRCKNPNCDSMSVVEIKIPGNSNRMYRCVKCSFTQGINVGGFVDF